MALIRARLRVQISSRLIRRLLKKAGLGPVQHLTLEQAKANLKAEYKIYSGLKSKASTLCTSFLERLTSEQAIDQDLPVDNHLQQLRDRENQRKLFRQIRCILNTDQHRQGIPYVVDSDGNECNSKESIEIACLQENKQRFHQAKDTPLLCEPLYSLLGPLGDGPATTDILQGTFVDETIDPVVLQTLQALQNCDFAALGPTRITTSDYQEIWRHSKERTSSCSKFNLHFGHYIAIASDDQLTSLHTQMVDITLMSGYSPARWWVGLNVIIPK